MQGGNCPFNLAAEQGRRRVVRGGSWIEDARYCRSAYRLRYEPGVRDDYLGFRIVLSRSETGASLPSSRQGEASPHPGPPPSDILTSGEGVGSESDPGIADLQSAPAGEKKKNWISKLFGK